MRAQQKLEWCFFDDDISDKEWQSRVSSATPNTAVDPARRWWRLCHYLITLSFLGLLLWGQPWQNGDATNQPSTMPTPQPTILGYETTTAAAQSHRIVPPQEITDRQALAEYQASHLVGYIKADTYGETRVSACDIFCSCVKLEPSGCLSQQAFPVVSTIDP